MQISSTTANTVSTATTSQQNGRLLAANLSNELFPNVPITATVKSVQPGQAVLDLGTTSLVLRTTENVLTPGSTVTVRFQESGKGTIDLGNGKSTTVTLETGDASGPLPTKSEPVALKQGVSATYTPSLPTRIVPTFSQSIIRVEVLPTPVKADAPPSGRTDTTTPNSGSKGETSQPTKEPVADTSPKTQQVITTNNNPSAQPSKAANAQTNQSSQSTTTTLPSANGPKQGTNQQAPVTVAYSSNGNAETIQSTAPEVATNPKQQPATNLIENPKPPTNSPLPANVIPNSQLAGLVRTANSGVQSTPNQANVVVPQEFQLLPGETLVRSNGIDFPVRFTDGVPDPSQGPIFVKVTNTPRGLVLSPVYNTPQMPAQLATAIIRSSPNPPEIGEVVQNILQSVPKSDQTTQPSAAKPRSEAIQHLTDMLTSILPNKTSPPDAAQIAEFVKHGGIMYESHLADAVVNNVSKKELQEIPQKDFKGQVLQALKEVGSSDQAKPLHQALDTIESQQALNVLSGQSGEGIRLQLPIWDQNQWRTVDLSMTTEMPEQTTDNQKPDPGYNIFMHTELTDFGDTYIDVSVHSGSFRGVLYIESESARQSAKASLEDLNTEVRKIGYQQVYFDVKSTSQLPAKTQARSNAFKAGVPVNVSMLDVRA